MRLSYAIRLGATVSRQTFMDWYCPEDKGTCALGSALVAEGVDMDELNRSHIPFRFWFVASSFWPWLRWAPGSSQFCPSCGVEVGASYGSVITHLNDTHMWTREQIADWVETVEPAEPETETLSEENECPLTVQQ